MYRDGTALVVSATDLVGFLACRHLTVLEVDAADGMRARPKRDDPELDVVARRGLEHEAAYLGRLRMQGVDTVEIDAALPLAEQVLATAKAIDSGASVIFQAAFVHEDEQTGLVWRGHADFLTLVEPSIDGAPARYEPEDTKLAKRVKPAAVLQLCSYAEQLERLQGVAPERIHVVPGGNERVSLPLRDFDAAYRQARRRFEHALLHGQADSYPDPTAHCAVCRWMEHCDDQRLADDHLSLVAGLTKEQARKLAELAGISTVAALAHASETLRVRGIGGDTLDRLRQQARLQVQAREHPDQPPPYELLPIGDDVDRGLTALPEPSPGDLFFDIEGDPFVEPDGLEYLLGVGWVDDHGEWQYRAFWAHTPAEEKRAFEEFVDFVSERRAAHPDLHIYHYAAYERSALGSLMGRHATRENEVDALFRGRVLVDLYQVVRQAVRIGTPSYSLKKLEPLYMERREATITDAGSSIVEYERWIEQRDQQILDDLEQYNEDDCHSTLGLRNWLEARRDEAADLFGEVVPRRTVTTDEGPSEDLALELTETQTLVDGLTVDIGGLDPEEQRARWLLAHLLGWHRREAKPDYWWYFHRIHDCDHEDLFDDTEAIAGLVYEGSVGQAGRSTVHRYRFDPDQEHKLKIGERPADPARERLRMAGESVPPGPGRIVGLDPVAGTIDLKRGSTSAAMHPTSLIPGGPVRNEGHRAALRDVAAEVVAAGIELPDAYRAVGDLVRGVPPRVAGQQPGAPLREPGEQAVDAAIRLARRLDHSYLPVQGPPGSGKTYLAARVALDLAASGKRVAVTANSHAVVTNLLCQAAKLAREQRQEVRILQKAEAGQGSDDPDVPVTNDNKAVEAAVASGDVDIVGGSTWLFVRESMRQQFDCLIIDEAGQLSLANAVAAGTAAHNLVLVGDPQQLDQPSKGTHPPGAGRSALEHILDGRATIADHQGLFLDTTRRLHPEICAFVSELAYDDRLHPEPWCTNQSIDEGPLVGGAGLRWVPVEHTDNRISSVEEAEVVAEHVHALLSRRWTNKDGERSFLGLDDVLVVAPYNAQVAAIASALPSGAQVGTVDKFQGQEAPVVIVSLAASSAEDVPRGMEFLYSRNRLNVAVSRAQALAIVVASPRLLDADCRTVEQLRLLNGLCRYVERASS